MSEERIRIPVDNNVKSSIKVIGVGGGGCNSVKALADLQVRDVGLIVCNTDKQTLDNSPVVTKLQLGEGNGAGGDYMKARMLAEQSTDAIKKVFDDGTDLVILLAGMGGGTGTGASPIVAKMAREAEILTVAIVTIPFAWEGRRKLEKAIVGINELVKNVDAIIIVDNQSIMTESLKMDKVFGAVDSVSSNIAKAISDLVTLQGVVNTDIEDVKTTFRDGKISIMNTGLAEGEDRVKKAIEQVLEAPIFKNIEKNAQKTKHVLVQMYCSSEYILESQEFDALEEMTKNISEDVELQWGWTIDDNLGKNVKLSIAITGYEIYNFPNGEQLNLSQDSNEQEAMQEISTEQEPDEIIIEEQPQNELQSTAEDTEKPSNVHQNVIDFDFTSDEMERLSKQKDSPRNTGYLRGRK